MCRALGDPHGPLGYVGAPTDLRGPRRAYDITMLATCLSP